MPNACPRHAPRVNTTQWSQNQVPLGSAGTLPQPCGHDTWRKMINGHRGHLNLQNDWPGNVQFQLANQLQLECQPIVIVRDSTGMLQHTHQQQQRRRD